jgi:ethanolamine utilization protein EutA
MGASEYSVQLSGNTTYISNSAVLLPRKNLQVVPLGMDLGDTIEPAEVARALRRALQQHDLVEGEQDIAISIRWSGAPRFQRLSALAEGLLQALPRLLETRRPLYVVTDGDIALSLGHLLKEDRMVASEVLVIDGITLWGFDFIDLGRIRVPSLTVPVTVKSLVFSEDPRAHGKGEAEDWHHHGDGVMHKHHHHHVHAPGHHHHVDDHHHDHSHDHNHNHNHDHGRGD